MTTLELERWECPRTGDRDLAFRGTRIGYGESSRALDDTRGARVSVYRTAARRYVVAVERWTRWERETGLDTAVVCPGPDAVLAALRDEAGRLSPAALDAWRGACSNDPDLSPAEAEEADGEECSP